MSVCWAPAWCECPRCGPLVPVEPADEDPREDFAIYEQSRHSMNERMRKR